MKLHELMTIGDGGFAGSIDTAIKNMMKHAKSHKSEKIRGLCGDAVKRLQFHCNHPQSLYDDPHTFMKTLSHFTSEPNEANLQGAVDTLGSYAQGGCD